MIYFAQSIEGGPVKIGYSESPQERFRSLQTGSPSRLRFLKVTPGDRSQEQEIHEQFAHLRVHGEWFDSDPMLLQFIDNRYKLYAIVRIHPVTCKNVVCYIDLRLATFDDQTYLVRDRLAKRDYFDREARFLYEDGCRKFGRKFQKLFQFD